MHRSPGVISFFFCLNWFWTTPTSEAFKIVLCVGVWWLQSSRRGYPHNSPESIARARAAWGFVPRSAALVKHPLRARNLLKTSTMQKNWKKSTFWGTCRENPRIKPTSIEREEDSMFRPFRRRAENFENETLLRRMRFGMFSRQILTPFFTENTINLVWSLHSHPFSWYFNFKIDMSYAHF